MEIRDIRRYRRALRQFQSLAGMQFRNHCCGVTLAQCQVLLEIDECSHLTMGQLALNLKLDVSTLSRAVDGLVDKKLVARLKDDSDRRLVWIRLTDDGASICQEIHESNDACCIRIFENIPPSQRDAVIQNLEILIQAYSDYEASINDSDT